MKKKLFLTLAVMLSFVSLNAKTLVAYYSYTNNVETIVNNLKTQIECDVVEIEPAEKGLDYAANNYALGTALLNAIRNNPDDASSYPAIDPVSVNMEDYETVIIACPLWWSQMAVPFQTFLFSYGPQMAGKNIGVIVSSASSGISGVVADAKRLIPEGNFLEPNLWIRSSQTSNSASMIEQWLRDIDYSNLTSGIDNVFGDKELNLHTESGSIIADGDFDTFAVYDIAGNLMASTRENVIDTTLFPNGIYIASLNAAGKRDTRKLVIRN